LKLREEYRESQPGDGVENEAESLRMEESTMLTASIDFLIFLCAVQRMVNTIKMAGMLIPVRSRGICST
jgi:hypothetical protein